MRWNIKLPALGEGLNEVPIAKLHVKPGDFLKEDDIYITLEVEKVDVEVPIPFSCKVEMVHVEIREIVKVGTVLLTVQVEPGEEFGAKENIANIKAAFHWLVGKSPDELCAIKEGGKYNLTEFHQSVLDAVSLAHHFKSLPIHKLDSFLINPLTEVLFELTLIIGWLEKFNQSIHTATEIDYRQLVNYVRKNNPRVMQRFYHLFEIICKYLDVVIPLSKQDLEVSRIQVFVVHGHDTKMADAIKGFLENLGLEPVILSKQAGRGETIIEKLERFGSVHFAIVILTPDDVGRAISDRRFKPRARQNVIFELGFFVGRLGRNRVRALYDKNVELPSDFYGVEYINIDLYGDWKLKLQNELRAAGLDMPLLNE